MSPTPIRVLIVDDHPVVRLGLKTMIDYESDLKLVGEASNGKEAVKLFRHYQPDVALIDLRMPEMDGVEAISAIHSEFPKAQIIILTTYDGDEDIYRGLQAGAKGYLLKDALYEELVTAIHKVYEGRSHIPQAVGAKLAERINHPQLSPRELDVIKQMTQGKSNQEIAKALCIAEGTVKFHVNNILSKLQVNDRTQAVITALQRGITSL